jgi:radical SAM protein with 4Fe4S-binding SPASM domain
MIAEHNGLKIVRSAHYNYMFDKVTGYFARWGKTKADDPIMAPAPELADIEISTICNLRCKACYKSNTDSGINMSFDTLSTILAKFPKTLTQIAYGIGSVKGNPDLWKILNHTREQGIIPNITVNGHNIEDYELEQLAKVCGAISVSNYNKIDCYGTVQRLTSLMNDSNVKTTIQQVNIHQLLSEETLNDCYTLIEDVQQDHRLANINAVIFLMLKPKGNRNVMHPVTSFKKFHDLFKEAIENGVNIGMDSCTAPLALKAAHHMNSESMIPSIEPCESGLFSVYVSANAMVYPCSFTEGEGDWKEGLSLLACKNFTKDIWNHPKFNEWKTNLVFSSERCKNCSVIKHCRSCPAFDITPCKE